MSNQLQAETNALTSLHDIRTVKKELRQIRDQINKLLEHLDFQAPPKEPEIKEKGLI